MQNERRIFIPGDCATGVGARIFIELDSGSADPQLLALGQEACRSCLQLPHCEGQRQSIAQELGRRGAIGRTIVGANTMDIPNPEAGTDQPARDSSFKFNLDYPLTDPRHMLEVIRQGFRSKQMYIRSRHAPQHEALSAYLGARVHDENRYGALTDEVASWSPLAAHLVLKYYQAQRHNWSRSKRLAPLSEEDLLTADAIQAVFIEDALALQEAGFKEPEALARVHSPEFYSQLVQAYSQSFDISIGYIRDILRLSPLDPIPAIERRIAKVRQQKEASLGNTVPEMPLPSLRKSVRVRELMKQHSSWTGHVRYLPELKPFLKRICSSNLIDPDREIKELFNKTRTLQASHPTTDTTALIYLAYHHGEDVEPAITIYDQVLSDLRKQYGHHPAFANKRLDRFAYTHLDKAPDEVEAYLSRLAALIQICNDEGVSVPESVLWWHAGNAGRQPTAAYIEQTYKENYLKTKSMDNLLAKLPNLEDWMIGKVLRLYEIEKARDVLVHLSRFLGRGYLTVDHPKLHNDVPLTKYDIVDKRAGERIVLGDLAYLPPEEQEAVLASFSLDRIVFGYDIDREKLLTLFKVSDIDRLVDEHILPHTRQVPIDHGNPTDLLNAVRSLRRDKLKTGKNSTHAEAALQKRLNTTLSRLRQEGFHSDAVEDPECIKSLRYLLMHIQKGFPKQILNNRSAIIDRLTIMYLEEAQKIKQLGCHNPYRVALGYTSTFCRDFLASSDNGSWQPSKAYLSRILDMNTAGQAHIELWRQRQIVERFTPEYKNRKIGAGYLDPTMQAADIRRRLDLYDETVKVYSTKVMAQAIHYYCFQTSKPDPIAEIKSWRLAVNTIDSSYRHVLGSPRIKQLALTRRGEKLREVLDDRVALFNKISAEYTQSPHPAIDDEVIRKLLEAPSTIRKQLVAQKKRWETVHTIPEIAGTIKKMDAGVLRLLLILNRGDPASAIQSYSQLQERYQGDEYIEPSMIDKAIKWGLSEAAHSINRLRFLLQKTETKRTSLDALSTEQNLHETVAGTAASSVEVHITASQLDPEAPTREQSALLTLLDRLPPAECAAVTAFYQVPWLLSQTLQDDGWAEPDKVCEAYGVRDAGQLGQIVENILNKIRS